MLQFGTWKVPCAFQVFYAHHFFSSAIEATMMRAKM